MRGGLWCKSPHTEAASPIEGDKPVKGFVYEVSLYSRLTAIETMTAGEVSLRGKPSDNGGDQRLFSAANILRQEKREEKSCENLPLTEERGKKKKRHSQTRAGEKKCVIQGGLMPPQWPARQGSHLGHSGSCNV